MAEQTRPLTLLRAYASLIRAVPRWYLLDLAAVIIFYGLIVVAGLIHQRFFDTLSAQVDLAWPVWVFSLLILARGVGSAISVILAIYATPHYLNGFRAVLFKNMFARLLDRPAALPLPTLQDDGPLSPGAIISIFRDDGDEIVYNALSFNDFWGLLLASFFAIVTMIRIDPWITLATVAPIAAIVFLVKLAQERVNEYRRQNREATSDVTGALGEIFGAAQAIQVAGAETRVIDHFRRLNERRGRTAIRDRVLTALIDAFSSNMVIIGTGLVLLAAARAVERGTFTVGDFALFTTYLWPIAQLLRNITGRLVAWQQSRVSLARMQGLLAGAPESTLVQRDDVYVFEEAPLPAAPEHTPDDRLEQLVATGLTCMYAPGDHGIRDVNLTLSPGEFIVVTGRVGAGKTTLLRALLGLLPLDAGTITWNGTPVADPAAWFTPPRCAYTPQVPRLFSDTLRENILMGLPPDEAPLGDAVAAVELAADVASFEHGLETRVGAKGTRLSGGQVQRAAAARALVRRPALYVFDDLSSALDVETELRLWRNIAAWQPQATFLVVSHRQPVLRHADRIILLANGRLADSGRLEALLARHPEMRALWSGEA